jgi:hypothetical protein
MKRGEDYSEEDIRSPDGSLEAHLGARAFADGLFVKNVASGEDKLIVKAVGSLDAFSSVTFSPDGQRLMFLAGGGTAYYPSNVMTVSTDGSDLNQLTDSTPEKWLNSDKEYALRSAMYSPDGRQILAEIVYGALHTSAIALLSTTDKKQTPDRLADGEPLFWSRDGTAIYFTGQDGLIYQFNLVSKQRVLITHDKGVYLLGRVPGVDAVFVRNPETGVMTVINLDGAEIDDHLKQFAMRIPLRDSEGR